MDLPSPYLFVYGTLRPAGGGPLAQFLAGGARLLGTARVPGRLYDLGAYPGLVQPRDSREWVTGEVYEMLQPAQTLAVLDPYEGCGPADLPPNFFERRLAPATLPSGEIRTCWVYFYLGPVDEERRIISGDYFQKRRR
jgi:gamma-glutamylcyclotransferase (GGCT)/AIG2-like uncharacterized protein YtfP